jgi:hypothetical protein
VKLVPLLVASTLIAGIAACDDDDDSKRPLAPPSARSWNTPALVGPGELAYVLNVAASPNGDSIVVWDELEGKVKAAVYDAASQTWSEPVSLDRDDNPDAAAVPHVAMDANGNAIAAWQRQSTDIDRYSVWTNRYDKASRSWGTAEQIEGSEMCGVPQVALDEAGNAVMVFSMIGALTSNVVAARADAATRKWSATEVLANPPEYAHSGGASIAMQPDGDAIIVWTSRNFDEVRLYARIWTARYTASTDTWSDVQPLSPDLDAAIPSGMAINEAGVAFIIWTQELNEEITVWASRSENAGAVWSPAQRIDPPEAGLALLPEVEVDAAGNAVVVWTGEESERQNIWSTRYLAAHGGWQMPAMIESDDATAVVARLGMDRDGNTLAIWTRDDDVRDVPWAAWYDAAAGTWGTPQPLETDRGPGHSSFPHVAVTPDGRAIAAWSREDSGIHVSLCR